MKSTALLRVHVYERKYDADDKLVERLSSNPSITWDYDGYHVPTEPHQREIYFPFIFVLSSFKIVWDLRVFFFFLFVCFVLFYLLLIYLFYEGGGGRGYFYFKSAWSCSY